MTESLGAVAVVTGAARGIGGAIARALAPEVGHVVVSDIDDAAGRAMAEQIVAAGGSASYVRCDLGSEADVRGLIHGTVATHGGVDVLVNNAGFAEPEPFPAGSVAGWRAVIEVNLIGLMLATQLVLPSMRARGGGQILNNASVAGLGFGPHSRPAYAASKAAVVKLTASLAGLHESDRITVTAICPDFVAIETLAAEHAALSPDQRRAAGMPERLVPLDEIAAAAVELLRDRTLAGRVLNCPHDGPWCLLPLD